MQILVFENGPFLVNTYLVINEACNKAFIIDPGSDIEPMLDEIKKRSITLEAIINTHGHIDHIAGVNLVKEHYNVPFYLNELDLPLLQTASMQARMFGVSDPGLITIDHNLPLSGKISVAGIEMKLLHTPGHSVGSISFYLEDVVFSGDALFNYSIGRTDLPGGSYPDLIASIKEKLFVLPDETRVLPGHGPATTVIFERENNPFF